MHSIANLLFILVSLYSWTIIVQVLLSWLSLRPGTMLFRVHAMLSRITDPYLNLFRSMLPASWTMRLSLDVSPVFGILALYIIMRLLTRL